MTYVDEDYEMLQYELGRVCSFLNELGVSYSDIGDRVIEGTDADREAVRVEIKTNFSLINETIMKGSE